MWVYRKSDKVNHKLRGIVLMYEINLLKYIIKWYYYSSKCFEI